MNNVPPNDTSAKFPALRWDAPADAGQATD